MLLWIVMAALAAAASLSVLVPLYRDRAERPAGAQVISVYRDQLGEVDRDLDRGLITEGEAEAARTEIARRLLRADATREEAGAAKPRERSRTIAALAAIVAIPAVSLGLYLLLGSPHLPDRPLSARLSAPPEEQDIAALVARVEAHLGANPNDGRGWEVIGPVYLNLGRNDEAVRAFTNALRLLGSDPVREANLGEAITRANGGIVTAEARAAFERAEGLDRQAVRPRFYLALALTQEGKTNEAAAAWRALLANARSDEPWVAVARDALAKVQTTATAGAGSPSEADIWAAATLPADERLAMINGMVEQLASRLEAEPDNPEGWVRLIRSYLVLGRNDEARAALAEARAKLDPAKRMAVDAAAQGLGLTE